MRVTWAEKPLYDEAAVAQFIAAAIADKPDGLLLFPMHFRDWP